MPNFSNIISLAYMRILGRLPDPGGLEHFNQQMNEGLTEALMREALLRSPEYAQKNPDVQAKTRRVASGTKTKAKTTTRKPGRPKKKNGATRKRA